MIPYVGLHRHSFFSMLDGYGSPTQIAERLTELGQPAGAVTDHGNIFAHAPFDQAMRGVGLKPIFGCEFYHVEDLRARGTITKEKGANSRSHLTILAATEKGYQNLLALSTLSNIEGFYSKPCIDWEAVRDHQEGLVVLSGCVVGRLSQLINEGKEERAFEWLTWAKHYIEHFYVEIIPCPGLDISLAALPKLWTMAESLNIPTVITDDAHFPRPEDARAEDAMLCIGINKRMDDPDRTIRLPEYHYHCSGDEVLERAVQCLPMVARGELEQAVIRSTLVAAGCNVELPRGRGPSFQVPGGMSAESLLYRWIGEGRVYRRALGLLPPEGTPEWEVYTERERYELEILKHHNFHNYFLIIADIIRWCKEQKILVLARGSCGGSLLCWYLGITQLDPIRFRLPVERFIDKTRPELPDIDLDFDTRYRGKVFQYLKVRYGEAHCGHVAALSTYRAKQSIRDMGKTLGVPSQVVGQLSELIPERLDQDEGIKARGILSRVFAEDERVQKILKKYPDMRLAAQLEGQVRHATIHAAGFVIDARPLTEVVGIVRGGKDTDGEPTRIISVDMNQAQALGLLKFDALAVDMLTVIAETLEAIDKDEDWLYRLPFDDAATYQMLKEGRNTGVFQLQGGSAGRVLQQLQVSDLSEFIAACGLCRPGPLQSGGTALYIDRKHGRVPMQDWHAAIGDILNETYGVILYQEQVMRIMREVGGMEWPDVHKIRKLVSKSAGADALETYYQPYVLHALSLDIPWGQVDDLWSLVRKSGNYLFNSAHNTEYGIVGYWTAYLKCHYPAQYTCAYARRETDKGRRQRMFQEFRAIGGEFLLLDPNESQESYTVRDRTCIVGGFTDIHGVGLETARRFMEGREHRPYRNWDEFEKLCSPAFRRDLRATGLHHYWPPDPRHPLNLDYVLQIAPWYIDIRLDDWESSQAKRFGCRPLSDLPDLLVGSAERVRFCGRVIGLTLIDTAEAAKKYGKRAPRPGEPTIRCDVTLADETGCADVMFSARKWQYLSVGNKLIRDGTGGIGDTWVMDCAISADRTKLFADNAICIRERAILKPVETFGVRNPRRMTVQELKDDQDQLVIQIVEEDAAPDEQWRGVRRVQRAGGGGAAVNSRDCS